MTNTLVSAALACIIAAIIGGGLKGFGIEIPVLSSRRRQLALGILGLGLLGIALATRESAPPTSSTSRPTSSGLIELSKKDLAALRTENGDLLFSGTDARPAISVDVYNGSPWRLRQIMFHLQLVDLAGNTRFDDVVALPLDSDSEGRGEPFKTSRFYKEFPEFRGSGLRSKNRGIASAYGTQAEFK